MLITSDRKFGVEIEFFCPTPRSRDKIAGKLNIVNDGSLRHIPNSGEYVSPVLEGKTGEARILKVCEELKKENASGEDTSMSVHLHLDGRGNNTQLKSLDKMPTGQQGGAPVIAVSNRLARGLPGGVIKNELDRHSFASIDCVRTFFNNIQYLSLGTLEVEPKRNFTYFWLDNSSRFRWLQNVFYFYTQYSEVMEAIVSNSRRTGNMYCIPLALSYELPEIEACKCMTDLRGLWYRGHESGEHYDDSRYHNVNLHSFWNRHGTVEIRSHGGTVDPHKILLWTKLHQKIVDKLETLELSDIKIANDADKYKSFLNFIEEPILQDYVKRLLGFYSGIIIK